MVYLNYNKYDIDLPHSKDHAPSHTICVDSSWMIWVIASIRKLSRRTDPTAKPFSCMWAHETSATVWNSLIQVWAWTELRRLRKEAINAMCHYNLRVQYKSQERKLTCLSTEVKITTNIWFSSEELGELRPKQLKFKLWASGLYLISGTTYPILRPNRFKRYLKIWRVRTIITVCKCVSIHMKPTQSIMMITTYLIFQVLKKFVSLVTNLLTLSTNLYINCK